MGAGLTDAEALFTAGTLNDIFTAEIDSTFQTVEIVRDIFPNFLNPQPNPNNDKRTERRQTLRFAALLLNDSLVFDATYPARHFRHWLKWLTWLHMQGPSVHKVNGRNVTRKAHDVIMDVFVQALPPGGASATPVHFEWRGGPALAVETDTTGAVFKIIVTSLDQAHVSGHGDSEDNVDNDGG